MHSNRVDSLYIGCNDCIRFHRSHYREQANNWCADWDSFAYALKCDLFVVQMSVCISVIEAISTVQKLNISMLVILKLRQLLYDTTTTNTVTLSQSQPINVIEVKRRQELCGLCWCWRVREGEKMEIWFAVWYIIRSTWIIHFMAKFPYYNRTTTIKSTQNRCWIFNTTVRFEMPFEWMHDKNCSSPGHWKTKLQSHRYSQFGCQKSQCVWFVDWFAWLGADVALALTHAIANHQTKKSIQMHSISVWPRQSWIGNWFRCCLNGFHGLPTDILSPAIWLAKYFCTQPEANRMAAVVWATTRKWLTMTFSWICLISHLLFISRTVPKTDSYFDLGLFCFLLINSVCFVLFAVR